MPWHRLLALVTALVLLTSAVARVAVAGMLWSSVECCCGEHAGNERCGCADCPAGDHGDEDQDSDESPLIAACGAHASIIHPAVVVAVVVPPPPRSMPRDVGYALVPDIPSLVSKPSPAPEPPPPRTASLPT